jgi:hypothetical protein
MYDFKLLGWLMKSNLWSVETGLVLAAVISYAKWRFQKL